MKNQRKEVDNRPRLYIEDFIPEPPSKPEPSRKVSNPDWTCEVDFSVDCSVDFTYNCEV